MDVYDKLSRLPSHIKTVDMHTCGEPSRIIVSGFPSVPKGSLLDKRRFIRDHLDDYRRRLMFEPRGHDGMYGVLLFPETDVAEADISVLFMHGEGYSTMCGHATIALGQFLLDTQDLVLFPRRNALKLDSESMEVVLNIQAPCGLVKTFVPVQVSDDTVTFDPMRPVHFHSVPAFSIATDLSIQLPALTRDTTGIDVPFDLAYGGAYYAIVTLNDLLSDTSVRPDFWSHFDLIKTRAYAMIQHINQSTQLRPLIRHPDPTSATELDFLYGVVVTEGTSHPDTVRRNVCIFANGQVDRSPCGSGTTARMAAEYAKGEVILGQERSYGSILSPRENRLPRNPALGFKARPVQEIPRPRGVGGPGIVVDISGYAFYTGASTFVMPTNERTEAVSDDIGLNGFLLKFDA